ncbi:MAG: glycosyltransferase [Thermodesulforhabdaceae bacterium]
MLKVLHTGWWTIEYRKAGGSIIHVETLMEYLHKHGCDNAYFCGGRYNPLTKSVYIKRWQKSYTRIYEVVNSPNVVGSYESTPFHIQCEPIEKLFIKVLETERPDVIHFHELESLTGSLLTIARLKRIPIVVGVHNYWYLCNQRDMMDINQKVCDNFQDGEKCRSCIIITTNHRFGYIYGFYGGYFRNTTFGRFLDPLAIKMVSLLNKWHYPLLNTVKLKTLPASLFLERRRFFVNELNMAQAIIFPSERVKKIYNKYDVTDKNSKVMHPISINFLRIKPKNPQFHPKPNKIVFGYLGSILRTKGVHLIIEAAKILKKYQDSFTVFIFGGGDETYTSQLKESTSGTNVEFKGRYSPTDIQKVLSSIDIAIVPSIWEDCAPIVVNELRLSKTPIIASRIGGIAEAVEHGVNGFLFEPGNVEELARYMKYFIENPQEIPRFMEATNWSFDMDKYAEETIEIYKVVTTNLRG